MDYEKETKRYTYREIAEADIEELIDNSLLYECYGEGVLIDIALKNHCPEDTEDTEDTHEESPYRLRLIGPFDNEKLVEYAKEAYNVDIDIDDPYEFDDWYRPHETEIDGHFLDEDRRSCIYDHLTRYTDNSNFVKFDSTEYALLEKPYIVDTNDCMGNDIAYFEAAAMGADKKYYMIQWEILPGATSVEDAENFCDWANPISVEREDL